METVLVTGGAGFIGSHTCEGLLEKGMQVVCLDNFEINYPKDVKKKNIEGSLKNKNFTFVEADIRKREEVEDVFAKNKIGYVIHLAAKTGVRSSVKEPASYFETNVAGTINILDMCVKHKVKKVVVASSSSVYGSAKIPFSESSATLPDSPYGASKLAAENICRIYNSIHGLKIVCLRFFTVYGPRGRPDMAPSLFTDKIRKGEPIKVFGDGTSMRDYTYVKDAVSGVIKALETNIDFDVINIGNSRPVRLLDFIGVIENLLGKKAEIVFELEVPGDMKATYADITKAQKILDYNPKTGIEQGMTNFIKA